MADIVAPVIASAATNTAGTVITITFTEADSSPILPASGATGFSLTGTSATIASVAISGTTATLTLSGVIWKQNTIKLNYTPGNITDSSVNALAAVSNHTVSNSSSVDATPIVEQIASKVLTALQSITVANHYRYTLTIQRPTRKALKPVHLAGYLEQDNPSHTEIDAFDKIEWHQPFTLVLFVLPEETDTTAIDTYLNVCIADIVFAIMGNPQWDGLAIDTKPEPPTFFTDIAGELDGFEFHFTVIYRTKLSDPFALAS